MLCGGSYDNVGEVNLEARMEPIRGQLRRHGGPRSPLSLVALGKYLLRDTIEV